MMIMPRMYAGPRFHAMTVSRSRYVVCAVLWGGILIWGMAGRPSQVLARQIPVAQPEEHRLTPDQEQAVRHINTAFTAAARVILPAVVSVTSRRKSDSSKRRGWFDFWWGPFHRDDDGAPHPHERPFPGLGSGVVISGDGYIITNHHVVADAVELTVRLSDKRELPARLIGSDQDTDVAVIKVDGDHFPAARLGQANDIQVGEWVLAVGNPFSDRLNFTITAGIVSAVGRDIDIVDSDYSIENFIQTDAAINPGNSGGPLINLRGEVVGINAAIMSRTGAYQGYGFAIPIEIVSNVINDLLNFGRVVRGYIGIEIANIESQADMEALHLNAPEGVVVKGFVPNSAGRRAGLRVGDVILRANGRRVTRANELQTVITGKHPGDRVVLELVRDGRPRMLSVTLQSKDGDDTVPSPAMVQTDPLPIGLTVTDITPAYREEKPDLQDQSGVVVTEVAPRSQAARKYIVQGDIIWKIGETHVTSVEEYQAILGLMEPDRPVMFYIKKFNGSRYVNHLVSLRSVEGTAR